MKLLLWAFIALNCASAIQASAEDVPPPRFADFPSPREIGRHRAVPLSLSDPIAQRYARALRSAASKPADFAGHYVLATAGCGAGCVVAGAIDPGSGAVVMLPFTVSDWPMEVADPLRYRVDSRLLIVEGSRDERGHGMYFYAFDGLRFNLVAERPTGK